jgi:NAD(P) transhydrogenase
VSAGTIPSKTIREAIVQLTGSVVKTCGNAKSSYGDISIQDVSQRVMDIVARETEVIRSQLRRNTVTVYQGTATLADPTTVAVQDDDRAVHLKAANILIACGTRPAHSPNVPLIIIALSISIILIR